MTEDKSLVKSDQCLRLFSSRRQPPLLVFLNFWRKNLPIFLACFKIFEDFKPNILSNLVLIKKKCTTQITCCSFICLSIQCALYPLLDVSENKGTDLRCILVLRVQRNCKRPKAVSGHYSSNFKKKEKIRTIMWENTARYPSRLEVGRGSDVKKANKAFGEDQ